MATQTVENYLKAMFMIANDKDEINLSELSEVLEVSTPTANSMAKNLHKQGLIIYEKYKPLRMTTAGKREAAKVIRKHRLTEMYLVEKMGFGWEEVHEIAEQVEHIHSPELFDRMDTILGNPTTDPHGSPIPDREGHFKVRNYVKLSTCITGQKVTLCALEHSTNDFLHYLNEKELKLGLVLQIQHVEAFDGSMTIKYRNHPSETLSKTVTDLLLVE